MRRYLGWRATKFRSAQNRSMSRDPAPRQARKLQKAKGRREAALPIVQEIIERGAEPARDRSERLDAVGCADDTGTALTDVRPCAFTLDADHKVRHLPVGADGAAGKAAVQIHAAGPGPA